MIISLILSFISLILAFSAFDWEWASSSGHSIFGMITLVFALIQILVGFMRCDKEHSKRFVFNHIHRLCGVLTFGLSSLYILDSLNLS